MKTIRSVLILDYYDIPLIFEAEDRIGGHYIANAIHDPEDRWLYAVVGVSEAQLHDFKHGKVDLRQLMLEGGKEEWFLTEVLSEWDLVLQKQSVAFEDSEHVPNPGYFMDSIGTSLLSVLNMAEERKNLILELRIEPTVGNGEYSVLLATFTTLLELVQRLISSASNVASNESPHRPVDMTEEAVPLSVLAIPVKEPFRLLLEGKDQDAKTSMQEVAKSLKRIDQLFDQENGRKMDEVVKNVNQADGRLRSAYTNLLSFLAKEELTFHYTWAQPGLWRSKQFSMGPKMAAGLIELVRE